MSCSSSRRRERVEELRDSRDEKRQALNDISNRGGRGPSVHLKPASARPRTRSMSRQEQRVSSDDSIETDEPASWDDIDKNNGANALMCTEYVGPIYEYLRETELKYRAGHGYMERSQRDINATMRGILIDWLVEVGEEYKLQPETLDLAVNYIDRFLALQTVNRGKLQLVGITCMLIAAKYEEIYAPQVDEFVYISDNTYNREEVLKMETLVLNTLSFELAAATAKAFLKRFAQAARADQTVEMLASYIAELTLQEYSFLKYLPSLVAASAISIAAQTFRLPSWNGTLEHYSKYKESDLEACMTEMFRYWKLHTTQSLQAIREKYSHSKFLRVSTIPCTPSIRLWDGRIIQ
eukprot:tig00000076_g2367.t1